MWWKRSTRPVINFRLPEVNGWHLPLMPLILALLLAAQPARAARSVTPAAPEFPANQAWLNGADLSLARLYKRRVVLVTFINVASMNSVRTFPVLNTWWQRYSLSGLLIIGVHTPDFDFDADPGAVKAALKRYGVVFPVVLDNEAKIWKSYANEGWPTMYLIDHKGRIVYDRLGEGGYRAFETEIRDALAAFNGYSAPTNLPLVEDLRKKECFVATPPAYFGTRRGRSINLNSTPEVGRDLIEARDGETAVKGKWTLERDAARLKQDNPAQNAFARVIFRGAQGWMLASQSGKPAKAYVKIDDYWLHAGNAGADVEWDDHDRSYVRLGPTRMFDIVKSPTDEMHELDVFPESEESRILSFEFADFCQSPPRKE